MHEHLDGIEVSITAVDMASLQQVLFYHRYEKSDFVVNAVFDNTLSESKFRTGAGGKQLEADHSKLDKYNAEEPQQIPPSRKKRPSVSDLGTDLAQMLARKAKPPTARFARGMRAVSEEFAPSCGRSLSRSRTLPSALRAPASPKPGSPKIGSPKRDASPMAGRMAGASANQPPTKLFGDTGRPTSSGNLLAGSVGLQSLQNCASAGGGYGTSPELPTDSSSATSASCGDSHRGPNAGWTRSVRLPQFAPGHFVA